MKNLNVTANAELAMRNFALEYSCRKNVKDATIFGSDMCDTVKDVNDYEKMIALFLAGKLTVTVEKMNEDCIWINEVVKLPDSFKIN
jgi:hypothetical protein